MWDKIGAKVDEIPMCVFGGMHYFNDERSAFMKFLELERMNGPYWASGIPYHWSVHLKGAHVLDVFD